MTTNQTIDGVPRELLENCASYMEGSASGTVQIWRDRLRGVLDAPAVEVRDKCGVQMVDCPECSHQWDHFFECGNKPAAQPQGEPVERQPDAIIEGVMTSVGISHAIYASTVSLKHGEQVKLYAEQPAPVAVVQTCCGSCPGGCVIQASGDAGKARDV